MATLTINGRRVKVDDSFLSLSPEQQNATVDEIAQSLGAQQSPDVQRSDAYNQAASAMSDMTLNPREGWIEQQAQRQADSLEKYGGQTGAGELFGNSFTLGLKDKVAGLSGAAGALLTGDSAANGYRVGQRAQEILEDRARDRSGRLGTVAEIAGSVGTGVLARAPAAATVAGRMFQSAKEAGRLGLIQGVGDSESDSAGGMAMDALQSGATSFGLGGLLTGGVEAGKGLFKAGRATARGLGSLVDSPQGRAARKVSGALADDGTTAAQAAARMGKRDTALINTGDENLLGLGRAASATPGEGRTIINRALDAQQKASQAKVLQAVDQTLGGRDIPLNRRVAQMIQQRSANGEKLYGEAFRRNFSAGHAMQFDDLAKRVPGEAVRNAMRIAQAEGRPFGQQLVASIDDAGNVAFRRTPSLQEWHYIQRGLRSAKDAAYRSGVGEVGNAYKNLHREILDAMDAANPTYKAARKAYSSQSEMIDAIQRGREVLSPSTTRNVDSLMDDISTMSAGEKEMMRIGMARQMEDLLFATPDAAGDMVKKIFGNQAKRGAIRAVFDNDTAFRKFETEMHKIAKETQAFRFVRTGSRTSFVDAEKQAAGTMAEFGQAAVDLGSGGGLGTTARGVFKLLRTMGGMDDKVAAEVAKILVEKDPNTVLRALSQSTNRLQNQAARDALLARAAPFARALSIGTAAELGSQTVQHR